MINLSNYKKVVKLRNQGNTFEEIAISLNLTRQRVWKMYQRVASNENYLVRKKSRRNQAAIKAMEILIPGYVYIIGSTDLGWFKIGISREKNLKKRLIGIERYLPFKIDFSISFLSKRCNKEEKILHRKFKEYRIKGEWFKLNLDHLDEVKKYFGKR